MAGSLTFTPEVQRATEPIYEQLKSVVSRPEWEVHAPLVARILELKRERNAIVLAHNYMVPEVFHGVGDLKGDSLALARMAAETEADVIVMAGVHFMAETAKLISPDKTVLMPDLRAGCSLAESITGADVKLLREAHPGVPVVTYVNTSADVKAESDICCTSGNAVEVVESLGVDRAIFLPDEYLGRWVASQTNVELILWKGHCEVHERFTADDLRLFRADHEALQILAHPECPPDVLAEADYVGSTAQMIDYVGRERPARVALITECSMSDNVAAEYPELEFVRPCTLCPHMKRITLPAILESLETMKHAVEVEPETASRARRAVEKMLEVKRGQHSPTNQRGGQDVQPVHVG
jgi:quinolinate synthase